MPIHKKLNDRQLIAAIREGDKDALVQLYKDNYNAVRNHVLKNNGSSDDADDILQEAAIAIWEKLRKGEIELKARLSTLVFAIARNLWLKRLNKLGRQVGIDGISTEKMTENNAAMPEYDRHIVVEMVRQLGDKCRELLTLFYFDGLDMNRIAEIMNYNNADTAKAKKHQCFKHLQEQFLNRYKKQDFMGL